MIKKLFFCVFLTACMVGNLVAQDFPETTWRDLADTSWFDEEMDEFDIGTAEELAGLSLLVEEGDSFADKTINIVADIDLDGNLWDPIGYSTDLPFSGTVQGNDHVISNLWITGLNRYFVGLFGQSVGGSYYNLILDTAVISETGDTVGDSGAMVGNMFTNGWMENCHARNIDITVLGSNVGGLTGSVMTDSYVKNCSFSGDVTGVNQVGGLAAQIWDKSSLSESWSEGTVTGEYIVGGLVGYATMAFGPDRENIVENSYSRSDVKANDPAGMAGGFYGWAQTSLTIKNSYSTGNVLGVNGNAIGGFIGKTGGIEVENVYFDTESSGLSNAIGVVEGPELEVEGRTTAEMTTNDFADILNAEQEIAPWAQEEGINDAYPFLGDGTMSVVSIEGLTVNLYPTAVDQQFFIQSDNSLTAYEIYSMQGQKVAQGELGSGENEIQVGGLSSGVYIVKIQGEQTIATKKIIKK